MCETTYVAHHTKPELCRSPNLGQPGRTRRARLVRRRRSQRACARRFSSPPARFPHGPNCFSMLRKAILTSTAPPSHRMNRPESPSTEPNSSTPRPLWTIFTRLLDRRAERLSQAVQHPPARSPARWWPSNGASDTGQSPASSSFGPKCIARCAQGRRRRPARRPTAGRHRQASGRPAQAACHPLQLTGSAARHRCLGGAGPHRPQSGQQALTGRAA
jgi:hypothetical protein